MTELIGDSTRDGRWSLVRLEVEGERIVSAEAEGLERPLEGLTLLEAAAVGGDELAVDALANALGPVFRAATKPGRVAVAMSGGVDSAVALLRAGPDAIGVTLRLWLDPQGPDAERACCSPAAVIAARQTCHRLGLPHVTLDLREEFRRAVVAPFVDGYARGETPNPCIRCNGSFRFAELLAFAARAGAERLATGHYARIVEHRGRLLLARAESQESCFRAGGDYREFLERHGLQATDGTIVDEDGVEVGRHSGFWRFTPGQRRGLRVATGPVYALRSEPRTNTVVVGSRSALATQEVKARGRLHVEVDRAEVKLRYRSPAVGADVVVANGGFRLSLDTPAYGVAAGQAAVLYEGDAVVGAGTIMQDPVETLGGSRALEPTGE